MRSAHQRDFADRIQQLEGGIIVSCQASAGEPLCAPHHLLALALSAKNGGARAFRFEGAENISFVRNDRRMPSETVIVGLIKDETVAPDERLEKVYITGSFEQARLVAEAGADIVALDATMRPRPDGSSLSELIEKIHAQLKKPVWADVATIEEGLNAMDAGADVVSTTLFGYTAETVVPLEHGPGFVLLEQLIQQSNVPVIMEGRVWYPEEVTRAFDMGAFAVVVGSAITRPQLITERFVRAVPTRRPTKSQVT